MTNIQLYLSLGVPTIFNAGLIGVLMLYVSAKFKQVDSRFAGIDKRFDDMCDLWRAELHRVEEVIDARLKHLEER